MQFIIRIVCRKYTSGMFKNIHCSVNIWDTHTYVINHSSYRVHIASVVTILHKRLVSSCRGKQEKSGFPRGSSGNGRCSQSIRSALFYSLTVYATNDAQTMTKSHSNLQCNISWIPSRTSGPVIWSSTSTASHILSISGLKRTFPFVYHSNHSERGMLEFDGATYVDTLPSSSKISLLPIVTDYKLSVCKQKSTNKFLRRWASLVHQKCSFDDFASNEETTLEERGRLKSKAPRWDRMPCGQGAIIPPKPSQPDPSLFWRTYLSPTYQDATFTDLPHMYEGNSSS